MLTASTDPFNVARDEVDQAVKKVKALLKEWRRLLETENTAESRSFQEVQTELKAELDQLRYDLEEVQASIQLVEEHRDRFQLSDNQLASRREFLRSCLASRKEVEDAMNDREVEAKIEVDKQRMFLAKRQKAEAEQLALQRQREVQESEHFLQEQRLLQKHLLAQQEDELQALQQGACRLGQVAHTINGELQTQQQMLDQLVDDIDREADRMDILTKGASALLKTTNKWQIYLVGGSILLFFVLLFLILNT